MFKLEYLCNLLKKLTIFRIRLVSNKLILKVSYHIKISLRVFLGDGDDNDNDDGDGDDFNSNDDNRYINNDRSDNDCGNGGDSDNVTTTMVMVEMLVVLEAIIVM